jgi:hypothetical protein
VQVRAVRVLVLLRGGVRGVAQDRRAWVTRTQLTQNHTKVQVRV